MLICYNFSKVYKKYYCCSIPRLCIGRDFLARKDGGYMSNVQNLRRICVDAFNDSLESDFALDLTLKVITKKNPCDNLFLAIYTPDKNVGFELYTNFKEEVGNLDSLPACWASVWARNQQLFSCWHYSTSLKNSIVLLDKASSQDKPELMQDKIRALITATARITPYTKLLNLNADDIAEINRLVGIVTGIAASHHN